MDTTHTWHPGAVRVTAVWPVPVPLLPDEILSSWIVRTALAHGCDPLVLTGDIWPDWRVWTCDFDRQVSSQRMNQLSRKSGFAVSALQLATLKPIEMKIVGNTLPINQTWPWITTTGARNRLRNGGMQFCPLCVSSDRLPYFRLHWRFAWHTACEVHGCRLLDRCPHCGAPIEPHRVIPEHGPITICPSCFGDLCVGGQSYLSDPGALAFQMTTDQVIKRGYGKIGDINFSVAIWMDVAHFFVAMLRRFSRSQSTTIAAFMRDAGIMFVPSNSLIFWTLEMGTVEERALLLAAVNRLMAIPLIEIVKLMEMKNFSQQTVCPKGIRMPEVVSDAIRLLKNATRGKCRVVQQACQLGTPRSCPDVEKMINRLRYRIARGQR